MFILALLAQAATSCNKNSQGSPGGDNSSTDKKWRVTTIAGNGLAYFANGPALSAEFRAPLDVVVTPEGTIYITDAINHRIRKIENGEVGTFAGHENGDTVSGSGASAGFILPSYLTIDKNGNVYTLDVLDPRVRKISPSASVSVMAGNGADGFLDGTAGIARFGEECAGIAIDDQGSVYISDWENKRIRKISSTGDVTTFAGNGTKGYVDGPGNTAELDNPAGLAIDQHGNLFLADGNRVRMITPEGVVSTFAGKEQSGYKDGLANDALFSSIQDLIIDDVGNIYLTDESRIRKINPAGIVSTIAGGSPGYEDGEGTSAKFNGPVGLGIDKIGNIYVADDHNNRIRKISFE